MYQRTSTLHRFGRPPIPGKFKKSWSYGFPEDHRPFQGGQQAFQEHLLKSAEQQAQDAEKAASELSYQTGKRFANNYGRQADGTGSGQDGVKWNVKLPHGDFALNRGSEKVSVAQRVEKEMEMLRAIDGQLAPNGGQRTYNNLVWYEKEKELMKAKAAAAGEGGEGQLALPAGTAGDSLAAEGAVEDGPVVANTKNVYDNATFEAQHGFSLVKGSELAPTTTNFEQLDMWSELGKYHKDMHFLYCISRRRSCYAVMYNYEGKRVHPVFSAGNQGFKEGQTGLGASGGADVAHQVTSKYLNEVIPVLRGKDDENSIKRDKYEIVVRVLGFYNGRGGALRAVNDRSDTFTVRYLEDITPFPLNGPQQPKKVRRNGAKKII